MTISLHINCQIRGESLTNHIHFPYWEGLLLFLVFYHFKNPSLKRSKNKCHDENTCNFFYLKKKQEKKVRITQYVETATTTPLSNQRYSQPLNEY